VHFGIGAASKLDWVELRWPSGLTEKFVSLRLDMVNNLREGAGEAREGTQ
jgi:hypothetical protein